MVFDTLIGMVGFFTLMFFLNAVANIFRPEPAVTPAIILFLCVTLLLVLWRIRRAKFFYRCCHHATSRRHNTRARECGNAVNSRAKSSWRYGGNVTAVSTVIGIPKCQAHTRVRNL